MVKCTFCQQTLAPGTGVMFVKNDARIFYYCSSKCRKHVEKLGRNPRTVLWTELAKHEKKLRIGAKQK